MKTKPTTLKYDENLYLLQGQNLFKSNTAFITTK